jgi:hypothetical protein
MPLNTINVNPKAILFITLSHCPLELTLEEAQKGQEWTHWT